MNGRSHVMSASATVGRRWWGSIACEHQSLKVRLRRVLLRVEILNRVVHLVSRRCIKLSSKPRRPVELCKKFLLIYRWTIAPGSTPPPLPDVSRSFQPRTGFVFVMLLCRCYLVVLWT